MGTRSITLKEAAAWLQYDPIGRKLFWFMRWLVYPLIISHSLICDRPDRTTVFKVLIWILGVWSLAMAAVIAEGGSSLIPLLGIPLYFEAGMFVALYLLFGLIHHWTMEELFLSSL